MPAGREAAFRMANSLADVQGTTSAMDMKIVSRDTKRDGFMVDVMQDFIIRRAMIGSCRDRLYRFSSFKPT
jgi:hypothetical protein